MAVGKLAMDSNAPSGSKTTTASMTPGISCVLTAVIDKTSVTTMQTPWNTLWTLFEMPDAFA